MRDNDTILLETIYTKLIQEAPIGNVSRLSDYFGKEEENPTTSYSHKKNVDINLMRSEKYAKHLKDNFFKKIPFVIDIIFDDPHKRPEGTPGDEYMSVMRAIKPNKQRIKAVIENDPMEDTKEYKGNKILTPWIIGHRIGHALFQLGFAYRGDTKKYGRILKDQISQNVGQYYIEIRKTILEYFEKINPDFKKEGENKADMNGRFYNYPKMYKLVSKFRSAREETVITTQEYIYELVAEYLVKGKIDFNPIPDEKISEEYAKRIENYMIKTLKLAKGGIIKI